MSGSDEDDRDEKVQAGGDKLQAQSEEKLAEMAGNPDLKADARDDGADADRRADTAGS